MSCETCYELGGATCDRCAGRAIPSARGYEPGCPGCVMLREPCAKHRPLTRRELDRELSREARRVERELSRWERLGYRGGRP